jgi:nucleoside phosphorylase/DNA-binding NarL/FixJ family response regulator
MTERSRAISSSTNIKKTGGFPGAIDRAKNPQQSQTSNYDGIEGGKPIKSVVIFTTSVVEHKAVEAHLKFFEGEDRFREQKHEGGTLYTLGQFVTISNGSWNVAIVHSNASNSDVAVETQRAIDFFEPKPKAMFCVGIAQGIDGVKIGDVVAANVVHAYEGSKETDAGTQARPRSYEASYDLLQRAQREAGKDDWRQRIIFRASDSNNFNVHIKPIASGEKEIKSKTAPVYRDLGNKYNDAIATEKGGHGFLKAAEQSKISAMVIRGIYEVIGAKNVKTRSEREKIAADNASAFIFEMLAKLDESGTPAESKQEDFYLEWGCKLPPSTIVLRIEEREGIWLLKAWHKNERMFDEIADCLDPPIELTLLGSQPWTIDIIGKFEERRPDNCYINKFLKCLALLQKTQKPTRLLIAEPSTSLIPWELMYLGNRALGVSLQTLRIPLFPDNGDTEEAGIVNKSVNCLTGRGIVYADPSRPKVSKLEHLEAAQLTHKVISTGSPDEVFEHLKQIPVEVGFILINMEAINKAELNRQRSFIANKYTQKMFVDSSRIVILENLHKNTYHRQLTEELLRYGAMGVLGMLSSINLKLERQILKLILKKQRESSNASVPEILRQVRNEIHDRYENEQTDEMAELLVASLMYIYHERRISILNLEAAA